MGKSSAPPAPDYAAAATAQGAANEEAARTAGRLNNPSFQNPLGQREVTFTGGRDTFDAQKYLQLNPDVAASGMDPYQHWTQYGQKEGRQGGAPGDSVNIKDTLTPTGQKLFDTNIATQQELGNLGLQGAQKAGNILGQEFAVGDIPGIEKTGNFDRESIYNALVSRAEGQNTRDVDQKRSQLIAQGIPVGSQAYNNEMDSLGRNLTDARQQANLATGQQQSQQLDARRQMISEAMLNRQTPLNEISALRSGSQVQQPSFQQYSGSQVAPAPIFGATGAQYQASMDAANLAAAQRGGLMNGLFGLGQAGILSGGR